MYVPVRTFCGHLLLMRSILEEPLFEPVCYPTWEPPLEVVGIFMLVSGAHDLDPSWKA